jgi:hypothetical protein
MHVFLVPAWKCVCTMTDVLSSLFSSARSARVKKVCMYIPEMLRGTALDAKAALTGEFLRAGIPAGSRVRSSLVVVLHFRSRQKGSGPTPPKNFGSGRKAKRWRPPSSNKLDCFEQDSQNTSSRIHFYTHATTVTSCLEKEKQRLPRGLSPSPSVSVIRYVALLA